MNRTCDRHGIYSGIYHTCPICPIEAKWTLHDQGMDNAQAEYDKAFAEASKRFRLWLEPTKAARYARRVANRAVPEFRKQRARDEFVQYEVFQEFKRHMSVGRIFMAEADGAYSGDLWGPLNIGGQDYGIILLASSNDAVAVPWDDRFRGLIGEPIFVEMCPPHKRERVNLQVPLAAKKLGPSVTSHLRAIRTGFTKKLY